MAKTLAAMERARRAPREALLPVLKKSGEELAAAQKALAETSKDTGALIESITVTLPGQSTPPYSQPGGARVAGETEVIVTAGNSDVRYAHLVEYGTSKGEAQPFFWAALRLLRKRFDNRNRRTVMRALRDAWKDQ
ncbi:HK97-gp10 family putative phage morphogenesis protein [Rhizobium sp. BK661]|uniref:HK97-gp10 family putative phage morphogenesis protein n=1 Tax=Rhizobium sp. BK661 TaxID=2586991 RepID=UPI0021696191|nr:HK97-gp10 family putative phage morphogenesis protein [Rhizobium sp. BK661]MCS3740230.1 HK97 gp10 family phage protein [Rhizobium sp. BK661]